MALSPEPRTLRSEIRAELAIIMRKDPNKPIEVVLERLKGFIGGWLRAEAANHRKRDP